MTMADDIPLAVRRIVYERDAYKCRWCGRKSGVSIHLHHVVYRSGGGKHVPENLISLCQDHHSLAHSSKDSYQQLLLDVLDMDPNITVAQLLRWRNAEAESNTDVEVGGLPTDDPLPGRVRRFLNLE